MKAAIYLGKEQVQIIDKPLPEVGAHDVLIKNIYSSICGTDVAVYQHGPNTGHRIAFGKEFGHETVSKVVAIGKEVKDFHIGQRVYPYPLYATEDPKNAGHIGGFSEYIRIPHAKLNHSLYDVDEHISDRLASLIEPFTVGCRAARRTQPKPDEHFVIFGCGTIGLAVACALKYFGAKDILLCDLSSFRLGIAENIGFSTCHIKTESLDEKACKLFGDAYGLHKKTADIDAIIDASGAESVFQWFMEHGKIDSRFTSVAVNQTIRSLDLLHLTYAQKSIIGSGGYMPEDVFDVMNILKDSSWDLEQIITHTFPLSEIDQALQTAADPDRAFNVVIEFQNS